MSEPTATSGLNQIVADYLSTIDAGAAPDRAALLGTHTRWAKELRDFFDAQDHADRTTAELRAVLTDTSRDTGSTASQQTDVHPGVVHTPPADAANRPQSIGHFDVLEVLGQGGMGVVYKARDRRIGRLVALKVIRALGWHDPGRVERFRREAQALAKLQHPHVVQLFEFDEWRPTPDAPPVPYLAMEYVPGGSLDRASRGKAHPPADAARLVELIARAVDAAHRAGVVHRDLKPENVLLAPCAVGDSGATPHGLPKVTDFGLARPAEPGAGPRLTTDGAVMGTPSYMAPEQANGEPAGPAADVWALGVMLYELLAGRLPFAGKSSMEVLDAVRSAKPPALTSVPADLSAIVARCLRKVPAARYGSAGELAEALRAWQVSAGTAPVVLRGRHRELRWFAIIAAVVLAIGWVWRQNASVPPDPSSAGAGTPQSPGVDGQKAALVPRSLPPHEPRPPSAPAVMKTAPFRVSIGFRMTRKDDEQRQLVTVLDIVPEQVGRGNGVPSEAILDSPTYVYLLWIDGEGKVHPVYPWEQGDWRRYPNSEAPVSRVNLPGEASHLSPIASDHSGMETLALLSRATPLMASESATLANQLPKLGRQLWPGGGTSIWSDDWQIPANLLNGAPPHAE